MFVFVCCFNRLHNLGKCVPSKMDPKMLLFRFSAPFLTFSCAKHVKIPTTIWVSKTHPHNRYLQTSSITFGCDSHVSCASTLLHVQSLRFCLRTLLQIYNVRQKRRQTASKDTTEFNKTSLFFPMNISLWRRHHPFIYSSIIPWPQCHCVSAHTHTQ